jgi:5'(3')-deoxyribonucleotidase
MKKPRLLLDVDGVLANFLSRAFPIIESLSGVRYVPEDLTSWDIFETVDRSIEKNFYRLCTAPGVAYSLPVYPGAKEGVARLQEIAEVYIVTSPMANNPTWAYEREQWLLTHFDIPSKRVVHTSAKHICAGDVLIDDRPKNIQTWRAEHKLGIGLLWDQPYNRNEKAGHRVCSWEDVMEHILQWSILIDH